MSKLKFEYNIRGYRYAPESFHIYKGLPGQKKKEIPLSDEQRQQMGYLCLTEGVKSAVDYVKHIERERERKCRDRKSTRLNSSHGYRSRMPSSA